MAQVGYGLAGIAGYIYNAEGQRVAKGSLSSLSCNPATNRFRLTNQYLLDQGGNQVTELDGSGNWLHSNVWAGAHLTATYDPKGLHFHLSDPLATRRVQTNVFGQVEENCESAPFGDDLTCVNPRRAPSTADDATEHHFTGKERDAESGNDYFGARYYASSMGRFMSPDWSAKVMPVPYAKMGNPQSLNLYAYVGNNPLNGVDADGHCGNPNSGDPYGPGFSAGCPMSGPIGKPGLGPSAEMQENEANYDAMVQTAHIPAQQQNSSFKGPGFWSRLGQRFNNFFRSQGFVTNAELPSSVQAEDVGPHEVKPEPNPYITFFTNVAGAFGAATGSIPVSATSSAVNANNDRSFGNVTTNVLGLVPGGLGDAVGGAGLVGYAGQLGGGVVTNNIMAPMLQQIPLENFMGRTADGQLAPDPETYCQNAGC